MGWSPFAPKYPTSDTPGATAVTPTQTRRERREAEAAEQGQRQRRGELRATAVAVRNGGDTDLESARKLIRRMMPDATDAEIREAYDSARIRR